MTSIIVKYIRVSNLDSHIHRLPGLGHLRPEACPVDLRDCPARHRPGVEELEHVIDGLAKRLLNDGLVVSHVVLQPPSLALKGVAAHACLWDILTELAERLYHVGREHVRPHRHPLPKLLKADETRGGQTPTSQNPQSHLQPAASKVETSEFSHLSRVFSLWSIRY